MPETEGIETPLQLGERYRQELRELVDDGEISASVAVRILDDLFEASAPGRPAILRWSVWCAYVEDAERASEGGRLIDSTRAWWRFTSS